MIIRIVVGIIIGSCIIGTWIGLVRIRNALVRELNEQRKQTIINIKEKKIKIEVDAFIDRKDGSFNICGHDSFEDLCERHLDINSSHKKNSRLKIIACRGQLILKRIRNT